MFQDNLITTENIDEYEDSLPKNYLEGIISGEFNAAAVYDVNEAGEKLYGFYITAVRAGWLAIVWFSLIDQGIETVEKGHFLRYIIRRDIKRRKMELEGTFLEIHMDEAFEDSELALSYAGLEASVGNNNIYEFTLSQVTRRDTMKKAAAKLECVSLAEAPPDLISRLDDLMQNSERPVPVPVFIDFEEYNLDISFICLKKSEPCGAVLFSNNRDYLIANLGFSLDPLSLPALLWNALETAEKLYGKDQKVLIPVVVYRSAALVEYFVPDAKRGKVINGIQRG